MSALVYYRFLYSGETVEDDSAATAFDVVNGCLGEGEADGDGDGVAIDCTEGVGHSEREIGMVSTETGSSLGSNTVKQKILDTRAGWQL